MILVIAEKPSLGRDIAQVLPGNPSGNRNRAYIEKGDYVITWVFGHMLALKEPEDYNSDYKKWDIGALPIYFDNWGLKIGKDDNAQKGWETKAERVKLIGELLEKSDMVIHAGDPDEEGQLLIDELLNWFNYKKPVKRLNTGDTTQGGLKKALMNMSDNEKFVNEGVSAYARSVADMMVGVNISRFFTCNNNGVLLSVGRVQTPTLGLVVNRDFQIEGHTKSTYYDIFADVLVDNKTVRAKYTIKSKDDNKITNPDIANQISDSLKGREFSDIKVEEKTVNEDPPLPFNLVKLQSYASSHFGYNPSDVMRITQSLRETHKAITYNRSDCQYLTEEHYKEAPKTLAQVVENIKYKPRELDATIHSKCFNDKFVTAHFAIIPTNNRVNLDKLTQEEKDIYLAVCKFYMAQFLPNAVKIKKKLIVKIDDNTEMLAYSTTVKKEGYLAIFKDAKKEDENDLSLIEAGIYNGKITDTSVEEKETKPPSRYTKATLNEDMTRIAKYVSDPVIRQMLLDKDKDKKGENGSIGTSATRSSIIDGLIEKGYLREDGKRLISTELGRELYRILPDEIKQADLTAKWWAIQEDIRSGEKDERALTDNVLETIKNILHNTYPNVNQAVMTKNFTSRFYEVLGTCPICGGNIIESPKAFGCSNWREPISCKFTIWKNPKMPLLQNVTITKAQAKKLVEGKSVKFKKLIDKDNKPFDAEMKIEVDASSDFPVKFVFADKTVLGQCPKCGSDVVENKTAFGCTKRCGFGIMKTTDKGPFKNTKIGVTAIKKWLKGESVEFKKLVNKNGDEFVAKVSLALNKETKRVDYKFERIV